MNKLFDLEDLYFNTEYKICSSLGAMENARYFQEIEGKVFVDNISEGNTKVVGRLSGVKLLFGEGLNDDWDAYSIFDNKQDTLDLGSVIYDFERDDFNQELNEKFNNNLTDPDVLFLKSIEILPDFRGNKVGYRFIKDFILNFGQDCSLVVIDKEPFYVQTNFKEKYIEDSFTKMMNYHEMITDYEKITYMLLHYFTSLGFRYFPEIDERYLFMCPLQINEKFDNIEFDL